MDFLHETRLEAFVNCRGKKPNQMYKTTHDACVYLFESFLCLFFFFLNQVCLSRYTHRVWFHLQEVNKEIGFWYWETAETTVTSLENLRNQI